jgi:hypothetical protein
MLSESISTDTILDFLPDSIRVVIESYRQLTGCSPQFVVEMAIAEFLEIDGFVPSPIHADSSNGRVVKPNDRMVKTVLDTISAQLKLAIDEYAEAVEMPNEFVVELAIAHFLDPDSMTYEDCQVGVGRLQIERLKQNCESHASREVA